uniref:Uncharacterized protein n=1 Tax=Anopheles stephensi TaxID=30069 RepID=A0A182YBL4_ANOST
MGKFNIVAWVDVASGTLLAPIQNKTFNFCKFLRNPSLNRLGQILLREVKRSGNAHLNCPFLPKLYQFRGISTGALHLPVFLPESNFVFDVLVSVKDEQVYDSRWYGMLKRVQCTSDVRC